LGWWILLVWRKGDDVFSMSNRRWVNDVACGLLFATLGLSLTSVSASQAGGQFAVTVNFQSANSEVATNKTGFCTKTFGTGAFGSAGMLVSSSGAFGAVVTIVCDTGAVVNVESPSMAVPSWQPMYGGAYRYSHLAKGELIGMQFPGSIDSYTGLGAATSWRMVNLSDGADDPDRTYLEMLIGW
jgi:hypothetical protein